MPRPSARACLIAAVALVFTVSLASAQDPGQAAPHVRGVNLETALLLHDLTARSPTARELVEHLNRSDVLLYVEFRPFSSETLRGRIGLLASSLHPRLFAIEIDPRHTMTDRLVALAHELQHAVEIADAGSVRDSRSMAALFAAIGDLTGDSGRVVTYETAAAVDTARRVRSELAAASPTAAADRN